MKSRGSYARDILKETSYVDISNCHQAHINCINEYQTYLYMMRITVLILLFITHASVSIAGSLTGRVVRVTDGDTIVVLDTNSAQHKIRLQGIDAPERGQAYGTKSKEHLSDSVAGKFVVVEYDKRDRYERILGKVLLSNQDMNL